MNIQQNISLKPYNTFGIDVSASRFVSVDNLDKLQKILTQEKDVFLLSGGSNMLLTKNIDKLVIHINIKGISVYYENESEVELTVNAGVIGMNLLCGVFLKIMVVLKIFL